MCRLHRLYTKQDSKNQNEYSQYKTESLKVLEKQQPVLNQSHILFNGNITKEEIVSKIKSLKNGKSVGYLHYPALIFQQVLYIIIVLPYDKNYGYQ